jgi:hypothetical protein
MLLTTEVKDALDLTPAERRSCFAMSYGSNGSLSYWLHDVKYERDLAKIVLVKEGDLLVGWAFRWNKSGEVGFWTRTTHRRRGIGTMMVQEVSKLGKIKTEPHDYPSAKLFADNGVLPKGNVRFWKKYVQEREPYMSKKVK